MTPVSRGPSPEPSPSLPPRQLSLPPSADQPHAITAGVCAPVPTPEYAVSSLPPARVDAFLDHLDTVFNITKPNGAQGASRLLFEDHWKFDPERDPDGVFVAVESGDNKIVSSVRVYNRHIHLSPPPSTPHATGGIGDVATNLNHRGKSLAKKLMRLADGYMSNTRGYAFGVLHAAPLAAPIYASIGWVGVAMRSRNVVTDFEVVAKGCKVGAGGVREVELGVGGKEVVLMRKLHGMVAPFVLGTFARDSEEYWVDYVGKCNDPRRVVTRLVFTEGGRSVGEVREGDVVGYAVCEVLRFELGKVAAGEMAEIPVQVKEVFVGKVDKVKDDGSVESVRKASVGEFANAISYLLAAAMQRLLEPLEGSGVWSGKVKLCFPAALMPEELFEAMETSVTFAPWWSVRELVDEVGWMFKVFSPFVVSGFDGKEVVVESGKDLEHILGPVRAGGAGVVFAGCEGVVLKEGADVFGFLKTDAF
ncbi:hypothetical protein HDU98_009684 [Podochytrium sp. JEL0797]|nr:hypothetical protein HDU98_009684 [Podochytrium sp. JEL0797]